MEFDETPRFWYPHVARDVWIDFYSWTVEIRPSEGRENLPFCFSFSLYPILPSFLSFSFLSFLLHSHFLLLFVPSSFLFISFQFLFSHFLLFLSFFFLFLFLHFLFWITISYGSSGGNFPPLSSLATCHHHVFLPYFL